MSYRSSQAQSEKKASDVQTGHVVASVSSVSQSNSDSATTGRGAQSLPLFLPQVKIQLQSSDIQRKHNISGIYFQNKARLKTM